MQKQKRTTLCDLKPQKKVINDQMKANPKEFYREKEKAYIQTLDVINASLIPYLVNIVEEKRPLYEQKEFYRYKHEKLQGLMTNMMEFMRLTNLEANLIKNSTSEEKPKESQFVVEINSPKKRDRRYTSRKFDCHYKNCAKVYNSRGALSFHMKSKHNKKSDVLKPEYLNKDTDKTSSQIDEFVKNSCSNNYSHTKPTEQQNPTGLQTNQPKKGGRMYQSAHEIETILPPHHQNLEFNEYFSDHYEQSSINSCYNINVEKMKEELGDNTMTKYDTTRSYKEDADCVGINENINNTNEDLKVYHFLDSKQTGVQEELISYFEYNCEENPMQRHPFFLGFDEDEVDRFNNVHNEVCYSDKDNYSILDHDTTPIDAFLTAEEDLENESLQSLLGGY